MACTLIEFNGNAFSAMINALHALVLLIVNVYLVQETFTYKELDVKNRAEMESTNSKAP